MLQLVIFIGLGLHIFNQYVKQQNKKYVDNSEFIRRDNAEVNSAVIYFFYNVNDKVIYLKNNFQKKLVLN